MRLSFLFYKLYIWQLRESALFIYPKSRDIFGLRLKTQKAVGILMLDLFQKASANSL